jgi:hypothetical protein
MKTVKGRFVGLSWLLILAGTPWFDAAPEPNNVPWPQYEKNPFVIVLDIPAPQNSAGGIVVSDVDGDGLLDYLVTVPGHVACYAHGGDKRWVLQDDVRVGGSSENEGLPGHNGPGVAAGDVDGDEKTEVLFLTKTSTLRVIEGKTGEEKWAVQIPAPEGAEAWEHLVIGNFRGKGDRDVLFQATNADGYRMGRYLAAHALEDLRQGELKPLWTRNDFLACAHNGVRIADLDGDGRDEILGGMIIGPDGALLYRLPVEGHLDSIFAADVRPDLPGLEVVALEEGGGNRVFLCARGKLIWQTDYDHWEPQNAALGDFDAAKPGLEVWCRSRFDTHQKPFVFDAEGRVVAAYELDNVAPEGWTEAGVEVIWTVDWTGRPEQAAAAKERHKSGDVAVFDPKTGAFMVRIAERADRLFVADVSGDWREELVVLAGNELHIYHNADENPNPDRPRLWTQNRYKRSKMTWNYYSP